MADASSVKYTLDFKEKYIKKKEREKGKKKEVQKGGREISVTF